MKIIVSYWLLVRRGIQVSLRYKRNIRKTIPLYIYIECCSKSHWCDFCCNFQSKPIWNSSALLTLFLCLRQISLIRLGVLYSKAYIHVNMAFCMLLDSSKHSSHSMYILMCMSMYLLLLLPAHLSTFTLSSHSSIADNFHCTINSTYWIF